MICGADLVYYKRTQKTKRKALWGSDSESPSLSLVLLLAWSSSRWLLRGGNSRFVDKAPIHGTHSTVPQIYIQFPKHSCRLITTET